MVLLFILFIVITILVLAIRLNSALPVHQTDEVLFIVRTYHKHFDLSNVFNIITMIKSLQHQHHKNWVAYLINTDPNPLPLQYHPLRRMMDEDKRIRILDLTVTHKYDKWTAGYDMTDEAINILKTFIPAAWLVVTNGDNWYAESFLDHIPKRDSDVYADVIITDYWSRYDTVYRKTSEFTATVCHPAHLKVGFVDLGGAILSFPKFTKENLKFMKFGAINCQGLYLNTCICTYIIVTFKIY